MKSHPSNLESLHLIRGFAVLFVLFYHLNTNVIPGQFAIDMFFVISGYVMSMILTKKQEPSSFLAARIIRVVPIYWATTFLVFILAAMFPTMMKVATANPEFLIKSLFFIPFYKEGTNIAPLHTVGWTLMFEVFFYLLLFSGMLLNKYVSSKISVLGFAFFMSFAVFFGANLITEKSAIIQFFQSQPLVENAYGILAFWINTKYTKHSDFAKKLYLPLVALIFGFILIVDLHYYHLRATVLAIPCLFIIILFSRAEIAGVLKVPNFIRKPLLYIADISLSMYLTHIFIFIAQDRILAKYYPIFKTDTLFGAVVVISLSFIVAAIVHFQFDNRISVYFRSRLKLKSQSSHTRSFTSANLATLK